MILGEIGPGHMSLMPFTEAFIMEVQRLASVLPICPPRLVTSDITVCGRLLKKGVQVQMNLYALHRNEEHWGPDVLDFRPERFWDNSGRVKQDEWLQPFGYGNFFSCPTDYSLLSSTFSHNEQLLCILPFYSQWMKITKNVSCKICSNILFLLKHFRKLFCFY